jgi:hypothetical protein
MILRPIFNGFDEFPRPDLSDGVTRCATLDRLQEATIEKARFDLVLELCSRRRDKTAAGAARAALGGDVPAAGRGGRTHQSEKNDRKIMARRQGPACSVQ